ncbi:MAG: caspase family protein [Bacteroidales bacterium]|nr:caspase family protein [Bacteroidales bacterium]
MKRTLITLLLVLVGIISASARTFVVAVGISDYKYISDLRLPVSDANGMAQVFRTHSKDVVTLVGSQATRANIINTMRSQFSKAGKNDQIIFFFSGHGYDDGFCAYDTQSVKTGLSYKDIYTVFRASKAGRKIIMADACHSGGLRVTKKQNANSKPTTSTDVMLFLSCRTSESSIERASMQYGLFTNYLMYGIRGKADKNRDRKISARELFDYVSSNVASSSGNRQHPVMWGKFDNNMTVIQW